MHTLASIKIAKRRNSPSKRRNLPAKRRFFLPGSELDSRRALFLRKGVFFQQPAKIIAVLGNGVNFTCWKVQVCKRAFGNISLRHGEFDKLYGSRDAVLSELQKLAVRQYLRDVKSYRIQSLLQHLRDGGHGSPAEKTVQNYVRNIRSRGVLGDEDIKPAKSWSWTRGDYRAAAARLPTLQRFSDQDDLRVWVAAQRVQI